MFNDLATPLQLSQPLKYDYFIYLSLSPSKGMCTLVSVSWYAFNITQDFFDPFYPGTK